MEVRKFSDEKDFLREAVEFILEICAQKAEIIRIALSGGSTPRPVYEALSRALLEAGDELTGRLEFYQVDERYVPADHPSSNQRMIREALLSPFEKSSAIPKFFAFQTSLPLDQSLEFYEQAIQKISPDFFDLVILGIGPDGHIASLFPNASALEEEKKLVAHTTTDIFEVKDRLTLTFPPILGSQNILVLLKGKEKSTVLQRLEDPNSSIEGFPAKKLLGHANLQIHFLM